MKIEEELRERLLEMNGEESSGLSREDRQALRTILKRTRARARRMKWVSAGVWIAFLLVLAGGGLMERSGDLVHDYLISAAAMGARSLFLLGLVMLGSFAARAWVAQNREFQASLLALEARLASLERRIK
jgi:hypothetical protein